MKVFNLIRSSVPATPFPMKNPRSGVIAGRRKGLAARRAIGLAGAMLASGMVAGCINVTAPEEPIVIELNVNIEARLLVELAEDASITIEENADIF